jgi:cyclopropane fatty-acyl-phospholipid synthase-like methyltransferase
VGRYYDRNTRGFLSTGEGGKSLAIHRGIWAPGTVTAAQAAESVPALILEQAREIEARNILDLGCGVGGTCLFLAGGLGGVPGVDPCVVGLYAGTAGQHVGELRIVGMTNSGAQVQIGRRLVGQRGLDGVVRLLQADYTAPDSFAELQSQDLVVALESFIHSTDLPATLANATAALRPGGRLVICDDMIMIDPGAADRDLADFKRCWHAYGLASRDSLTRLCGSLGLDLLADEDLSPLLRLFRPRDRLAAFFIPVLRLFRNWSWAQNLVGGTALQRLLARGCLAYRYQVWVKPCRDGQTHLHSGPQAPVRL